MRLMTRWGRALDPDDILSEYPRPNLRRDSCLILNGEWDYGISKTKEQSGYEGKILVPFSPETLLSGVSKTVGPEDHLHYRRFFRLPEGFQKDRVLLHFGAVDQECEVFVNDHPAGSHKGGYLPFSFDITEYLVPGDNVLRLCVTDKTELAPHARGKQKLVREGKYHWLFYPPQSGIWKTVWLESVTCDYIREVKITPLFDERAVRILVLANREQPPEQRAQIRIWSHRGGLLEQDAAPGEEVTIPLEYVCPWTPEHPNLYDVKIQMGGDQVSSYFGMRKFSAQYDKKGVRRFFLNNEPFFFNGLLDQGYWPESLMTAPSDEALLYDIVALKELGYNTIRKHVKVEPERFYYHCDRLGMIVWQDMPNGGGEYDLHFVTDLPNESDEFARSVRDGPENYEVLGRSDPQGREQYYRDLRDMIALLYNHPCIAAWVPFNEGWGQFDAAKATALVRQLDPTRLINEACGWFDQGGGDMHSIHHYSSELEIKPSQERVVALTEYGGYAYPVEGHTACENMFGYQVYRSSEELMANYLRLWEEKIYPNLKAGLSAAIYTQTSDIEEEINGIMTYDREISKLPALDVLALNEKLYRLFDELTE